MGWGIGLGQGIGSFAQNFAQMFTQAKLLAAKREDADRRFQLAQNAQNFAQDQGQRKMFLGEFGSAMPQPGASKSAKPPIGLAPSLNREGDTRGYSPELTGPNFTAAPALAHQTSMEQGGFTGGAGVSPPALAHGLGGLAQSIGELPPPADPKAIAQTLKQMPAGEFRTKAQSRLIGEPPEVAAETLRMLGQPGEGGTSVLRSKLNEGRAIASRQAGSIEASKKAADTAALGPRRIAEDLGAQVQQGKLTAEEATKQAKAQGLPGFIAPAQPTVYRDLPPEVQARKAGEAATKRGQKQEDEQAKMQIGMHADTVKRVKSTALKRNGFLMPDEFFAGMNALEHVHGGQPIDPQAAALELGASQDSVRRAIAEAQKRKATGAPAGP